MKLMLCANLDVGGLPTIDLPSSAIGSWQQDKIEALASVLSDASERGVEACVIAGGLYAKGFISQSLFCDAIEEAGCHGVPVYYIPLPGEAEGLEDRVGPIENVTTIRSDSAEVLEFSIEHDGMRVGFRVKEGTGLDSIEDEAKDMPGLTILRVDQEVALVQNGKVVERIGTLEPSSFGEPLPSGYSLLSVEGDSVISSEWIPLAVHPFIVRQVELVELESSRELVTTVGEAVKDVDRNACLRIELRGRIPLDVYINTATLAAQLEQYFFYVEVADECTLDIDVADLDTDVSLLAEFVRRVTGDDSLSETEKTRILRCGWNVLNGKELAE